MTEERLRLCRGSAGHDTTPKSDLPLRHAPTVRMQETRMTPIDLGQGLRGRVGSSKHAYQGRFAPEHHLRGRSARRQPRAFRRRPPTGSLAHALGFPSPGSPLPAAPPGARSPDSDRTAASAPGCRTRRPAHPLSVIAAQTPGWLTDETLQTSGTGHAGWAPADCSRSAHPRVAEHDSCQV